MSTAQPLPPSAPSAAEEIARHARKFLAAALAADPMLDGHYVDESVIGLISQEYEGRAVAELLQNAHDQLDPIGRIHVELTESATDGAALLVANDGVPFGPANFEAILKTARSSKKPGSSIGYKGVGFKAVLLLGSSPEIYSMPADRERGNFNGFRFRLARRADVLELLDGDEDACELALSRVPPFAVPIPIPDPVLDSVRRLADLGYATVVRVPLDQSGALEAVRRELGQLLSSDVPPHLFLSRLSTLSVVMPDQRDGPVELTRQPRPRDAHRPDLALDVVDLGPAGEYLVATKRVALSALEGAINASVDANLIDPRWKKVSEDLDVSVACRLGAPASGRFYTFLPMGPEEVSPFAGHANAPFATRLARDRVKFDVPLNEALLREIADCAQAAAAAMKSEGTRVSRSTVADLVAWTGPMARRFASRLAKAAGPTDGAVVPTVSRDGAGWAPFGSVYVWRIEASPRVLDTDEIVRRTSAVLIDPELGQTRADRLARAALEMFGHQAEPPDDLAAGWAEEVALSMAHRRAGPARWLDFYDDLADLFDGSARALEGRRLLLVEGGQLAEAGMRRGGAGTGPVVFFPPVLAGPATERAGPPEDDGSVRGRVPASLAKRIAFMDDRFVWTRPRGRDRENRPGRDFLATNRLVRPYEAQDVLLLVRDAVTAHNDRRLHADALKFVFAQTSGRAIPTEPRLDSLGLRLPTRAGAWAPASATAFGAGWAGTDGRLLEATIDACSSCSPGVARLRGQLLADPDSWPALRLPRPDEAWTEFLRLLGVKDGLWPVDGQRTPFTAAGWEWDHPEGIARSAGLDPVLAERWVNGLDRGVGQPTYTTVPYQVEGGFPVLPGQGEFESMEADAKFAYADAVAAGLARWDEPQLVIHVRRPRGAPTSDAFSLPSPVATFAKIAAWIPVTLPRTGLGPEGRQTELVAATEAWYHEEATGDRAPSFVPLIGSRLRRLIAGDERLRKRLVRLGVRVWDDPKSALGQLGLIATSYASFGVAAGLELNLRKAYQRAWAAAATASRDSGLPLPARLLVSVRGRLETYDTTSDARALWVAASEDRLTDTALRMIDHAVLVADPGDGRSVAALLAPGLGERLRTVGAGDTTILIDGLPLVPSLDAPRLIDEAGGWLAECVALTLELKTTLLNRQSEGTVRQALQRLRRIRWQRGSEVTLRVLDVPVPAPPGFSAGVPADDDEAPTVVLRGDVDLATWDGLRATVPIIAELLHQSLASPALELALVKLAQRIGTESTVEPKVDDYAAAFDEQPDRIRAVLLNHREELADLLARIRPVVAVLAGFEAARSLEELGEDQPPDPDLLRIRLASITEIGERAGEILAVAVASADLADLRDRLGIDVATFNAALRALGDPYRPLTYEPQAWEALERVLRARREEVFDALRARFVADFDGGRPLDEYARRVAAVAALATPGRQHSAPIEGLAPDPQWPETYERPPEEIVRDHLGRWLAEAGAALGQRDESLPRPLDDARAVNGQRLEQLIARAAPIIAAWCAVKAGRAAPDWTQPGNGHGLRLAAHEAGLLDFRPIDDAVVIRWLLGRADWPLGMEPVLDLARLALTEAQVEAQRTIEARHREAALRARRSVTLDDEAISLVDDLPSVVVARVLEGLARNRQTLARAPRLASLEDMKQRQLNRTDFGGDSIALQEDGVHERANPSPPVAAAIPA